MFLLWGGDIYLYCLPIVIAGTFVEFLNYLTCRIRVSSSAIQSLFLFISASIQSGNTFKEQSFSEIEQFNGSLFSLFQIPFVFHKCFQFMFCLNYFIFILCTYLPINGLLLIKFWSRCHYVMMTLTIQNYLLNKIILQCKNNSKYFLFFL